jgi:glycosyltransferase involved in cell wall biosynthesis
MQKLSVAMICYNEEAILDKSLAAVQWADEIVIVDSFSSDRTLEIAGRYTDKVIQHAWQGYGRQKNLALEQVSCPWVLSLDADEVVSPELAGEIRELLAGNPERAGYRIPRMTCYLGRTLRHAWYPDHKLRLFQRGRVRWGEEQVHESVYLDGPSGTLTEPLIHHSFASLEDHLQTLQRYTSLGADDLARAGRSFSLVRLLGSPLVLFVKQYVLKRGFLDGIPGLIASVLSGFHEFVKYAKLYERRTGGGR